MTRITNRDGWLHHDDGSHASTPPSANGSTLETFERAIRAHLARHEDSVAPGECETGDPDCGICQ